MSNGKNNSHSDLPFEELNDTPKASRTRENRSTPPFIQTLSRLLQVTQILATLTARMLSGLTAIASKLSRSMKTGTVIGALVTVAIIAGHSVSAQVVAAPPPLSSVKVPILEGCL